MGCILSKKNDVVKLSPPVQEPESPPDSSRTSSNGQSGPIGTNKSTLENPERASLFFTIPKYAITSESKNTREIMKKKDRKPSRHKSRHLKKTSIGPSKLSITHS